MARDLGLAAVGTIILLVAWRMLSPEAQMGILESAGLLVALALGLASMASRVFLFRRRDGDVRLDLSTPQGTAPAPILVRCEGRELSEIDSLLTHARGRALGSGAPRIVFELPEDAAEWMAALETRGFDLAEDHVAAEGSIAMAKSMI